MFKKKKKIQVSGLLGEKKKKNQMILLPTASSAPGLLSAIMFSSLAFDFSNPFQLLQKELKNVVGTGFLRHSHFIFTDILRR